LDRGLFYNGAVQNGKSETPIVQPFVLFVHSHGERHKSKRISKQANQR